MQFSTHSLNYDRIHRASLPLMGTCLLLLVLSSSCRPSYPNCESDDHCLLEGQTQDYCVNGACQECITDAHCIAKKGIATKGSASVCNTGRCEERAEHTPTCTEDADCPQSQICHAGQCKEKALVTSQEPKQACQNTSECGADKVCEAGFCTGSNLNTIQEKQIQGCHEKLGKGSITLATTSTARIEDDSKQQVLFEFDDYQLTLNSRKSLEETADCLRLLSSVSIVLEGHCDERGTQEYNLALGEKRAATVRTYLKALGVPPNRMLTRSKGENEPLCDHKSEDCYALNRRVVFIKDMQN